MSKEDGLLISRSICTVLSVSRPKYKDGLKFKVMSMMREGMRKEIDNCACNLHWDNAYHHCPRL